MQGQTKKSAFFAFWLDNKGMGLQNRRERLLPNGVPRYV
jgi:hypothetical protein